MAFKDVCNLQLWKEKEKMRTTWKCDFCKNGNVIVSLAGILYCDTCRMSYGESLVI